MTSEIEKIDPENIEKNKKRVLLFKSLGYVCMAAAVGMAVISKFKWAVAFGVGILVFSQIENRFAKRLPDYHLEE